LCPSLIVEAKRGKKAASEDDEESDLSEEEVVPKKKARNSKTANEEEMKVSRSRTRMYVELKGQPESKAKGKKVSYDG
jgi:hypothetical protein